METETKGLTNRSTYRFKGRSQLASDVAAQALSCLETWPVWGRMTEDMGLRACLIVSPKGFD